LVTIIFQLRVAEDAKIWNKGKQSFLKLKYTGKIVSARVDLSIEYEWKVTTQKISPVEIASDLAEIGRASVS